MKKKLLKAFLEEEKGSTETINKNEAFSLLEITKGCRPSMHEPDEAEVSVQFEDGYFDNAGGSEMSLRIFNGNDYTRMSEAVFNMASLIALARLGAEAYLDAHNFNTKE